MLQSPTLRAALAFGSLSAWLVLLFSGVTLGRAIYLLPVAALALFPWRWLRKPEADPSIDSESDALEDLLDDDGVS